MDNYKNEIKEAFFNLQKSFFEWLNEKDEFKEEIRLRELKNKCLDIVDKINEYLI